MYWIAVLEFVALNSEESSQSSTLVQLPYSNTVDCTVREAWRVWKARASDPVNGPLTRQNVPVSLEYLVDQYRWYPETRSGIMDGGSRCNNMPSS